MSSDASQEPPSGTRHLSTEISDIIIDYLHNDKKSLAACSLVARHWLPASRYHLIPRITVDVGNADDLLALLDAPHSTLTGLVTELAILAPIEEDIGLIYTNKILSCTKKFAFLNSLIIFGINFRMLGNLRSLDHIPTLGITKLFIGHCSFESNDQFSAFLSLFKVLEQISTVRSDDSRALPSSILALPPSLKILWIMEYPLQSTKWWATQRLPRSLRAIRIDGVYNREEFKDINLLVAAASGLKCLDIVVSDEYTSIQDTRPCLNLSSCPSLEEFIVTIRCLHENQALWFLSALVASTASSSGSLNRLNLVIELKPQEINDLYNIPWKNLDAIFADETTSPTKILIDMLNADFYKDHQVVLFDEEDKDKVNSIIYEGLNDTVACGKLEVRYPPESPMPRYMVDIFEEHDEMYPT